MTPPACARKTADNHTRVGTLDPLDELVARSKIQQLAVRYALAVDGKDLDTLATLYVDELDKGHGPGPEGIRLFFDHVLRGSHCAMHLIGNHLIDFDSDTTASGVVYCRAQHHVLEPEYWWDVALVYFDSYERRGDGWLFGDRRLARWYLQDIGHPDRGLERQVPGPDETGVRMPDEFSTVARFWAADGLEAADE